MKWYTYPNSTKNMFNECVNITEIDLTQFDLTSIRNMINIFKNCENLTNVIFGNYDTSNLNNVHGMFYGCGKLASIDLSKINTLNVASMVLMFFGCSSLQSLNLSNFKTGKVKNFFKMFRYCQNLESLDLSNFDTSSATNISYMFADCTKLSRINLSSFDTSNVVYISHLFIGCSSLISLDISNFNTSKVEDMSYMFHKMNSLNSLNISNFDTSNVLNMSYLFNKCRSLEYLNLSNFNVSNTKNMSHMFQNCSSLEYLDVSNFDVSKVENMENMFRYCSSLIELNLSNWNAINNVYLNSFLEGCTSLKYVNLTNFNTENVMYMHNMFSNCSNLTYLDLSYFNTSQTISMKKMFFGCSNLISINLSNFNTSNCDTFDNLFRGCSSLIYLDLSHFNTSNIENISYIFKDCHNLEFINLSNWGSSKIVKIDSSFRDCYSLKEIDLSNFNTLNVKYMNNMFINCFSLVSLDLSSFDTNQVINMGHMFCNCSSLISLNITHFNTSNVQYFDNMFSGCSSLISIDISNFHSKHINNMQNMFKSCTNLSYINMKSFIEYNTNENIYNNIFNGIQNNLIICIQKNQTPIITKLINEIRCATIYCGEDLFRIRKNLDIYKNECILICPEEYPFEIISTQQCVNNCHINFILKEECKINFEENKEKIENTKTQDIMLRNVEMSFTSQGYNTFNLDNGNEEIIKDKNMQITLTTSKMQKNNYNNNNNTSIDLGDCESLLRKENGIPDEELLYMRKIDVYENGMNIPKVEFDIYYKENNTKLKKLNLTICENCNIYLSYPVDISENPDIYNPKSDYYNNICYPTTSNKGIDITLSDRQKEFDERNKTLCQDGCYFEKYDNINKRAECSCKGKEFKSSINSIADIKIDKKKLIENFIDVNNIINIQIIKCYKILFTKESLINNIAFYFIIPIILLHIISIFIFYKFQRKEIFDKINDIIFAIKNSHIIAKLNKGNKIIKDKLDQLNKNEIKIYHHKKVRGNKNELVKPYEKNNIKNNNLIKSNNFIKNNNRKNGENNAINIENNINENSNKNKENGKKNIILLSSTEKKYHLEYPPIKIKFKKKEKRKSSNKKSNVKKKEFSNNLLNFKNKEKINENVKKIMEYNDREMNEFTYEQALKYDKRNYIQYYCSLLKTKYILISTFYTSNDYNSKIVKIDLFFVGFVTNFTINALFFNDDNMHKIYEDYGTFDILYQLPQIIYSYLISVVFDYLFNLLALSDDDIIEFKKIRKKRNLINNSHNLKIKLNIKFSFYFIISTLFLLCF